jgi:hypothetical protein
VLSAECVSASDLSLLPNKTALLLLLLLKEEIMEPSCSSAVLLLLHLPAMAACFVLSCTAAA